MPPPGCQCDKIGEREGMEVYAITDSLGPQVVCRPIGVEHGSMLSHLLANHEETVALAQRVVTEGFTVCRWQPPVGNLAELYAKLFIWGGIT